MNVTIQTVAGQMISIDGLKADSANELAQTLSQKEWVYINNERGTTALNIKNISAIVVEND